MKTQISRLSLCGSFTFCCENGLNLSASEKVSLDYWIACILKVFLMWGLFNYIVSSSEKYLEVLVSRL